MMEFLNDNASAIFGLLGALGGAILSFWGTWIISNRKYKLENWRILSDRRIKAHEHLIELALEMRVMHLVGGFNDKGEVRRSPNILADQESFMGWLRKYGSAVNTATTWITIDAKRESGFIQDYFLTLSINLEKIDPHFYPDIGEIIRQDFIDLSQSLETKAYDFFRKDIHHFKIADLQEWHKYPLEITKERLSASALMTNIAVIESFIGMKSGNVA